MKKLVLFLLLSVAVADSGYAFIFGGGAWRRHYRRHRTGQLTCVDKAVGPTSLQSVCCDGVIQCDECLEWDYDIFDK